jgi:hypothetical protein
MADILCAVLADGLSPVDAASKEALAHRVRSADVILTSAPAGPITAPARDNTQSDGSAAARPLLLPHSLGRACDGTKPALRSGCGQALPAPL